MDQRFDLPLRTPTQSSAWIHDRSGGASYVNTAVISPDGTIQPVLQPQDNHGQIVQSDPIIQHTPFHYDTQGHTQVQSTPLANLQLMSPEAYAFSQSYTIQAPLDMTRAQGTVSGTSALPLPQFILPSQNLPPKPCLACGKLICRLASHKYFTQNIDAGNKGKDKSVARSFLGSLPSPTSPTVLLPLTDADTHWPMPMDAERIQFFHLWNRPWNRNSSAPEQHLYPHSFLARVLPSAKVHAPLLQALIAYSGTVCAIAGNTVSPAAANQQLIAVQMLSQACPSETEAGTDASMLAALLLLLIYMAQGNSHEVGKHVAGLVHLTRLRGGPYYLGMKGLVAEVLVHADAMQAIFFDRSPTWDFPLPALNVGAPQKYGNGFRQLNTGLAGSELSYDVVNAAQSLSRVADVLALHKTLATLPVPGNVRNSFSYLQMITEYQLAKCNARLHTFDIEDNCVNLALILFNNIVHRNDGTISPSVRKTEYKFWTTLNSAELNGLKLNMQPTMYMWMVVTGLSCGIRAETQFHKLGIEKLKGHSMTTGIIKWQDFREKVLDRYVWLPEAQEDYFRGVWQGVENG